MSSRPSFESLFGKAPQARAQAPGRVNLLGEHTDYNDGFVLPTAIPQTTQVEVAVGATRHQVYSADFERLESFGNVGLAVGFAAYVAGCLRVLQQEGFAVPYLDLRLKTDVPIGAGLSSSAALEVAILRAVDALLDLGLDPVRIAQFGQRAEVEHVGLACGIMDQMASSLASATSMLFLDTRTLEREVLPLPAGAEILVVHSGVPRSLTASAYNTRRAECAEAARRLGVASLRDIVDFDALNHLPEPLLFRVRHVVSENARVLEARLADRTDLGRLMNASHASLRDDYEVSVPQVDRLVEQLQAQPEVLGARMTGAGFGGCCVALVREGSAAIVGDRICGSDRNENGGRKVIVPKIVP